MSTLIIAIICLFVGALFGFLTAALCCAAKWGDE